MNFEQARAEYERLRQGYETRAIGPEEYTRRIQQLQVRDEQGAYWAIDGATGNWLRYDGSNWVPGQPPGQPARAAGGYGAPDAGATQIGGAPATSYAPQAQQPAPGYGQQQGQTPAYGYGQAQAQPPQAATPPAAAPKRRNKALIGGCAAVAAVLLLACIGGGIWLAVSGRDLLNTETGITEAATARAVDNKNQPSPATTDFSPNNVVYITYVAKNVKQGQKISVRLSRDGQRQEITGGETTVTQDFRTLNGYFRYTPSQKGEYIAELYLDGEPSPSQQVTFSVK